jgi:hypothetical protein
MGESLTAAGVAAILVCFLLVYLRTRRLEELLRGLGTLEELNRELRGVRERLPRTDLKPIEELLRGINESVRSNEAAVRQLLERLRPHPETELRGAIERSFAKQGYGEVRIRSDLGAVGPGRQRLQVEVTREGAAYKGFVVVEGGSVVDSRLLPTYEVFP